jgi:hypothetical protein
MYDNIVYKLTETESDNIIDNNRLLVGGCWTIADVNSTKALS